MENNEKKIVKCELLWTRICSLKCSYCSMATGKKNSVPLELWMKGMGQLKKLNCDFLAVYGAEPLDDFDKLASLIFYVEGHLDMRTTVITSGLSKNIKSKLEILYDCNLRSLTTSYDMVSLDSSSDTKSNLALKTIDMFRSFGPVRDVAVIATLTKKNYKALPETIKRMSNDNIWTFFDLIHADRGQTGSKVKNTSLDLMFSSDDFKRLIDVLNEVLSLKKQGYLCHASEIFINKIIEQQGNIYKWNCAKEDNFPAWVTVDCNGVVYPCDDFQPDTELKIPIWKIYDEWSKFSEHWKAFVKNACPGCCWNTHIDAHAIKRNELPLTDYIHGTEEL